MMKRRTSLPPLPAALLALLAVPAGLALWAQTPPDTDPPQIQVLESGAALVDGRLFNRAATPVVQVTDASTVTVDATLDGAAFTSGTAVSGEGTHLLSVTATDAAGNSATVAVGFGVDTTPPAFLSLQPAEGAVVAPAQLTLQGEVAGAATVTVDGQPATLAGQGFTAGPYTLAEGPRAFAVVATDAAGNTAQQTLHVVRDSQPPTVALSQPAANSVLRDGAIDVTGSAQDPRLAAVTVNGIAATVTGTTWLARQVPLAEGSNTLTARAEDRAGNAAQATRTVVRDSQPPEVAITDPASGTVVPGASITLRGTAADPHLDRVEVNGVRATLAAGAWSLAMSLREGTNDFTVRAFDRVSNAAEATVSVVRDSEAPAVRIALPADGARLNAQSVAVSGTVDNEAGITITVNGVAATVTGGTFSAASISLVEGDNTLIARAKDAVGNQGTHTRVVVRDTVAPRLASADPATGALALPVTASFRLTFSEEIAEPAAGSWRLETGAGQALPATANRAGEVLTVYPSAPLPSSTQVRLVLTAGIKDLAGNALAQPPTLTFLTADTTAPGAPVLDPAPPHALCAASLPLAGTAEAGAVVRVQGGAAAAEGRADETGHFALSVQLSPGGLNHLQVTSTDSGGNVSAAAVVDVVHDCQAPRVTAAERQGNLIKITFSEPVAAASLSSAVTLSAASGAIAGGVSLAPNGLAATFTPGGPLPSGALRLEVSTAVQDLAGNAMAYPFSQVFGAAGGSGFLLGTVIDDATGRPLAGARVLVTATNGTPLPEPLPEQVTGEDGRFRLPVPAGTHDLTIVRSGYTPAFRLVTSGAGQGTDVFDPRLTPAAKSQSLGPAGGTWGSGGDAVLTLPAGALAEAVPIAVTRLAEQGLPMPLPYGWSPRGAAWLDLGTAALQQESTLGLPVESANGTTLVLVHLDLAALQWRVLGTAQVTGGRVTFTLPVAAAGLTDGGWAAVEADDGPLAPPAPVVGAVLAASARPAGNEATAAALTFNPEVVLPSQSSQATAVYTVSQNVASGLPLTLLIQEELTLLDESVRRQTPYQADLILYHAPDGTPRSRFLLRPSQAAQALPLKLGAEDVTLRTYGGDPVSGNVVGPEGGTVTGDQGDRIDLPPGAVTDPTAVVITRKGAADLGLAIPAGTELAGVVDLDLAGKTLLVPAALSLSLSPAPAAGEKGLLLQVIDLGGVKAFRAVAALQATASGWTTAAIDTTDLAWPGVREEGLYAFVRLTAPAGYLRGTVRDVGGLVLAGGVVRGAGIGWLQITNADGTYVLPAPVGAVTATAENRVTGNAGSAATTVPAADARVDLDILLQAVGPRVIQITPADGAVDVPQGIQPTIRFSEPVDPASAANGIQLLSDGQPVAVNLSVQGTLVHVTPRATLLPATVYELRVTSGVHDVQGNSLDVPVSSTFTTLRVLLTRDVDLSRVFLVAPDATGHARVLGRAGAVPANALVFVENRSALVTTPSTNAGQDGGFDLSIQATLSHTLILHVLIPNSNEIVAKLTPFRTPDLKGAYVDDKAVTYTTGDGVTIEVPAGAFSGPALVRLEPQPLSASPAPVPTGFAPVYNFTLDFGGATAKKPLQISIPKPAGAPDAVEGVYLLNRMIVALGKRYWMMHDIMRLDAATGRLTTDLPPQTAELSGVRPEAVVASLGDPFFMAASLPQQQVFTAKAIVRQYKYYVTGSAFPGQYQVAASQIPLGFTIFPSFNMNFLVGIWNLGMEGMATAIDRAVETLLEGDGILMPTRRHEPYKIVVRDLTTGFRLYENTFAAPTGDDLIPLPPDVYGDTVPPTPVGGTPIQFITLNFSGPAEQEVGAGITASLVGNQIHVSGEANSTQSKIEVHLIGLDDDTDAETVSDGSGAFVLEAGGRLKNTYILAIGARIPVDQPLEIRFSEALNKDFNGIELLDGSGTSLKPDKMPVGTNATVRLQLKAGWRAGQHYTLRLTPALADASGNTWDHQLDIGFEASGSDALSTVLLPAVRDVARLGSWLFVAAEAQGMLLMDASDPSRVQNVLPGILSFPFPLNDPVRSVAVDPHGRVLVAGGGVSGFGQLKIFDPLAVDVEAITSDPGNQELRLAAYKGSTIISDKLGGPGTQLPSGLPRRVAVLSNDLTDEWKLGDPKPLALDVVSSAPANDPDGHPLPDFTVTVSGNDAQPGMPVTIQDLTRGRWNRVDAETTGHYSVTLSVREGDRLRVLRNQDSIAYVATTGVGVEVVDVNAFYNEDHNFVHSDIRGTYSGYRDPNLQLCGQAVADLGTALTDLDTLFDPQNLNPLVVVGQVGQRGFVLLRSNPESVGELSLLNEECTEVDGSTAIAGLAVLQHYQFDFNDNGRFDPWETADYILVAHQKGGILIYDVTDREEIKLVGQIRMPGQVSQISVDRDNRRLLVAGAGAGFYIVNLDLPPSKTILDEDHDGKDDRILETVTLSGNTNAMVRLVPELGLAFAGGVNRGLTPVVVGHPQVDAVARDKDGRFRKITRLAPFGVPTAKETANELDSPDLSGSFRVMASLPALVGDEVTLDVLGASGPAAAEKASCSGDDRLRPDREITLHRLADKPYEPGYQLYMSEEVAVLADLRAARDYERTAEENESCTRCDLNAEGVSPDAIEILSGDFVNVLFPDELRHQLRNVYTHDRIDASELRLASVHWDLSPAVDQEAEQDPCLGEEAPGVLGCSGEKTLNATDISLRGRGFDFVLRRFYRSQTVGSGPFGPGWDHNYNQHLRELPNGDVEIYDGLGRAETFAHQDDGTLKAPKGMFVTLERVESGWVMLDAHHGMTRFDDFGRLASIADAVKDSKDTGNEMTFEYDLASRLVRVRETTGRDILFEYNDHGCGQITKITDFSGREFVYEYDDKDRLITVKTPPIETVTSIGDQLNTQTQPLETHYTYDTGNGSLAQALNQRDNLTSVVDAKGQAWLQVGYGDAHGSQRQNDVVTQTWGGGSVSMQYNFQEHSATVTDPRGQQFAYTYTPDGQVEEAHDPADGMATFTHDDEGLVTSRTDAYGRVTTYAYDANCDGTSIGDRRSRGNLTRTAVTPDSRGANGSSTQLVTCTEYEGYSNQPVRVVDPRGTITLISRNQVGLPVTMVQASGTPEASTTQTTYNEFGQPTQVVNPNGHVTRYLYNSNGYASGFIVDPNGLNLVTKVETDSRGNIVIMVDPRGVSHTKSYNALDWMTASRRAVTASLDGAPALNYVTSYYYDPNGNVAEERQPYGDGSAFVRKAYVYGPVDELLQTLEQPTPETPFSDWSKALRFYDANRNLIKMVGPDGQATEYTYDSRNQLMTVVRGAGTENAITEHNSYDLEGRKVSHTDGRGGVWATAYDGYGRISKTVDPLGNEGRVTYDDTGNAVQTGAYGAPAQSGSDPILLAQKLAEYDRLNRPKSMTQKLWTGSGGAARDVVSRYEYDPASNLTKVIDPLNRELTRSYDTAERLVATVDPKGNRTEFVLDAAGNPTITKSFEVQSSGGAVEVETHSSYDALGRLSVARDGVGNPSSFGYDARNNLRLSIDAEGFVTERTYDGFDRLSREVKPEGIAIDYSYDKSSRLVSYKDALGNITSYEYDALDRRTRVTYPDQKREVYSYDLSGNIQQVTDANGNLVSQTFDAANRLSARTVAKGSGVVGPTTESYVWDGLGRLTRAQSGDVITELTFDSLSRVVKERNAGREVTNDFDDLGNATGFVYPSGYAVRQTFDELNRPTSIGKSGGGTFEEAVSYAYRGPELVSGKTLANGLGGERQYDSAYRLLTETFRTASGQTVFRQNLAWTPRGLRAAEARGDLNDRGWLFAYDGAGRLAQAARVTDPLRIATGNIAVPSSAFTGRPDAFSFSYDAAQNLLSQAQKENGVPEALALPLDNSGRNRPASVGGVPLEWDANGNLIRKGDLHFEYDYRNRLRRVARGTGEEVATYDYDAFNRRVRRTVGSDDRETVWRGWQQIEEYKNGGLDQRRVYGLGLDEIVQLQVDLDGNGTPEQKYAPLYDETGNLVAMTGNAGKPIERYEYTPYGQRKVLVDNTPPTVEQVRVKGSTLWVEISEEISSEALAKAISDHTLNLVTLPSQQALTIEVAQPVVTGRQARRRLVITTAGPPAAGTQVRLTVPAAALQDSFLNRPTEDFQLTFAWPAAAESVIQDTQAIELQRVTVHEGSVEIELTEEPDATTLGAIQIDGAAVTWTLQDDHYTLVSTNPLQAGSHALTIGTGLADLNGSHIAQGLTADFVVAINTSTSVFEAPDPRESTVSTIGNLFGFQGLQIDPETGLIYMRNRYYDPELGRFITADPMQYTDGPSTYSFAGNDPVNLGDPMGLCLGLEELTCGELAESFFSWDAAERSARFLGGEVKGFVEAPIKMVEGTVEAVTHPVETITGLAYAVTHLPEVAEHAVDSFVNGTPESQGEVVGNFLFDIVSGGIGKAGEAGEIASDVNKASRAAKYAEEARDVSRVGRAAEELAVAEEVGVESQAASRAAQRAWVEKNIAESKLARETSKFPTTQGITRKLEEVTSRAEKVTDRIIRENKTKWAKIYNDPSLASKRLQKLYQAEPELVRATIKGNIMDEVAKKIAAKEEFLTERALKATKKGLWGPDFTSGFLDTAWDVTTQKSWARHVSKYGKYYSKLIPLLY